MAISFDAWVAQAENKWIDRDGAPAYNVYQCHDVWLDYMNKVYDLPTSWGYAPGNGWTSNVWTQFPYNAGLANHFVKVGPGAAQPGDVAFWPSPHVAVVLADAGGSLITLSQNNKFDNPPTPTVRTTLSKSGMLGYLRPKNPPKNPTNPTNPETELGEDAMKIYLGALADGSHAGKVWLFGPRGKVHIGSPAEVRLLQRYLREIDAGPLLEVEVDIAVNRYISKVL